MKNPNYKKQFRWFSIFEYEKEEEYLRGMHRDGWKLVKVNGFGVYHFEKCIPEDVVYQLDYNREGIKNKEEYVKMFADCGWEHLMEYAGYSYFRKPAAEMKGEEAIFCDDESKIAMMKRVMIGRAVPLVIIFGCCLVPQFIINLVSTKNYYIVALYGALMGFYLAVFLIGAKGYLKIKNKRK